MAACNFDTPHLRELVDRGVPVVANQVQYSLVDLRPENAMLAYAKVPGGWNAERARTAEQLVRIALARLVRSEQLDGL